ncbi:hypothetical protein BGZ95_009713 [Linnemannia exigua]|uniref:Uncharacterized protein n=1 Tax=Linnemannia exigua TaxID=604196 RepID=A0AAD4H6I3_9FUNG|nr:hypothetical protein BGZ95_009713 [Linnemannia exigua]
MASLLHCVVPQLVARSGASAVRQRTVATLSSSSSSSSSKTASTANATKGAAVKASGTNATSATTTAAKGSPSTSSTATPPKAEENPLWILYQEHKGNPWAIGTVVVAALCGDAAVSYVLFGRKDKKAEEAEEAVAIAAGVDNTTSTNTATVAA